MSASRETRVIHRNQKPTNATYPPKARSSHDQTLHKNKTYLLALGGNAHGRNHPNPPYLAYTLGDVPAASLSRIGICGLFFFIVGYARVKKDLDAIGAAPALVLP